MKSWSSFIPFLVNKHLLGTHYITNIVVSAKKTTMSKGDTIHVLYEFVLTLSLEISYTKT